MRGVVSRGPRVLFLAVIAMTATTCAGGPVGPDASIAPPSGTVAVFITVQRHTGSFTLTLGGETISTDGAHRFNVPPGVQQVTGQMTVGPPPPNGESPAFVSMDVTGLRGEDTGRQGGPQRGSIQSSEGPEAMVGACNLSYQIFTSSATQSASLKFSFNVSGSASDGNARQREQC